MTLRVEERIAEALRRGSSELDLSRCGLKVLPDTIGNLLNLTRLNLGNGNKLTALPDTIGNLTSLAELRLDGNKFTALPDTIGDLTSLAELRLDGCWLTTLPDTIGNLTNLNRLHLDRNKKFTVLPDTIGSLISLAELRLDGCRLTALPDSIGNLTNLTRLRLTGSKLTALPDSIGNLTNLTELYLEGNQLTALPDSISNLTNLTRLHLGGNQLTALPDSIGSLTNLTELGLDGNRLIALPDSIGNLTNLTHELRVGDQPAGQNQLKPPRSPSAGTVVKSGSTPPGNAERRDARLPLVAEAALILSTQIPSGRLLDFDLVSTDAGPLLVGAGTGGVCTWDPLRDRWATHRLDSPWPPGEGRDDWSGPTALGAMVVDGRIVIGGGSAVPPWEQSEGQPFAQWDLDSGEVRTFADPDDFHVGTVGTLAAPDQIRSVLGRPSTIPGNQLFLVSPWAEEAVAVWDASQANARSRIGELNARYDRYAAPGKLGHRPVLVTKDEDGRGVLVWDLDERLPIVEFNDEIETDDGVEMLFAFGLSTLNGRPHVIAAGATGLLVAGDLELGEWGEPFSGVSEDDRYDETDCHLAVGVANGRPVAVTCTDGGHFADSARGSTSMIRLWDLERRQASGAAVNAHEGGVVGVQLTELEGRPVAVTVGRSDSSVRVWALVR